MFTLKIISTIFSFIAILSASRAIHLAIGSDNPKKDLTITWASGWIILMILNLYVLWEYA